MLSKERGILPSSLLYISQCMCFHVFVELKVYQEIEDHVALVKTMEDYLEDHNAMTSKPMSLVLFQNAIEHVARISRIICQPMGNALLVGVGGSGRKSLTVLAVSVADFKLFQIEISKSYGMAEWREDLRKVLTMAGADNRSVERRPMPGMRYLVPVCSK